jgi:L-seryl-tRNA(Ser) seleniumtransferase
LASDPELERLLSVLPRRVVVDAIREVLDQERKAIRDGGKAAPREDLVGRVRESLRLSELPATRRVVNATGVVLHTNLGRAAISAEAADAMRDVAAGYCNLEYDLAAGERSRRGIYAERLLARLACSEDALIVNNNAAGVLLMLNTMAEGREVIVSSQGRADRDRRVLPAAGHNEQERRPPC